MRISAMANECLRDMIREARVYLTPVPKKNKWIFLVGCYNSGTTLLSEILRRHPEISGLSTEGHFITSEFIKDYDVGLPRMWVDREDLFTLNEGSVGPDPKRVKKEWAMRLNTKKKYLMEKSPPNVPRMRWINHHFESPYFIGIVRNGYAVAEGIARKAKPMHLKKGWPIEKCAYQWARSNEVMLNNSNQVKNFILIKYEDLTENTADTIETITKYIGAKNYGIDQADKEWMIHERSEPIRNLNLESISRLTDRDKRVIRDVAGPMLERFGYKHD